VSIELDENCFSHYDAADEKWVAESGQCEELVGTSSRTLPLGGESAYQENLDLPGLGGLNFNK
jgi:hypothetical protein